MPAPEKIIFIFVDAFGWLQLQKQIDSSALLQRFLKEGIISQLTSQFPSTTTAHVTTLHTNQPVGEHGMYEWYYYEPAAGAVISPLYYSYAGDHVRGTLKRASLDPALLFPRRTIYPTLTQQGIASYVLISQAFSNSPYSRAVGEGATRQIAFSNFSQALDQLSQAVLQEKGPAYYYLYWGKFDELCHIHGPNSAQAEGELDSILESIESRLLKSLPRGKNILLLIGADHGQDRINPQQTVYINHLLPDLAVVFKTTKGGRPVVPGGMCKSFFLYIKEDALHDTERLLAQKLAGIAQVLRVSDLIRDGYFGLPVSERFLSRVGNLVIVPNRGESVWWFEPGRFEVGYKGFHGGLTQDEMLIPLLALAL